MSDDEDSSHSSITPPPPAQRAPVEQEFSLQLLYLSGNTSKGKKSQKKEARGKAEQLIHLQVIRIRTCRFFFFQTNTWIRQVRIKNLPGPTDQTRRSTEYLWITRRSGNRELSVHLNLRVTHRSCTNDHLTVTQRRQMDIGACSARWHGTGGGGIKGLHVSG
jgi:hypothetical protein